MRSIGAAYRWVRHSSGTLLTWRTGPVVAGEMVDLTVHKFARSNPAANNVGGVAGGGVELRAGKISVAPEFRYTRWNARYWEFFGSRGYFTGSNLDQAELMVGVAF